MAQTPKMGSGGIAADGFTGTLKTNAKDKNGKAIDAQYVNGILQTTLPDGTVVHTGGGDYIYRKPRQESLPQMPMYATAAGKVQLDAAHNAARQQAVLSVDAATQKAEQELRQLQQDAEVKFEAQKDKIDLDEAMARDNHALYAEARGDKGGIGQSQYDSIMNTAATSRLAVNQAQTKLATDTALAMTELRAQGEFQKADALLELSQTYLSQLTALEQFAQKYNLSVAQFNAGLTQWQKEYDLKVAGVTGIYGDSPTLSAQKTHADAGWTLLEAGILPSKTQLSAMDMDETQAKSILTAQKVKGDRENARKSVELALKNGGEVTQSLCAAAGYDFATVESILAAMESDAAKDTATAQLTAMLKEGVLPSQSIVLSAGWDWNTVQALAAAVKARLSKKK